jgi:superfamily II helicase
VITSRAKLRYHRQIGRLVGYRLPEGAFQGATLEALLSVSYDSFDRSTKDQILAFIKNFLSCKCRDNPFCGCPERKFIREIIDLRESSMDHTNISAFLLEEYGIEIYPADILSYLEEAVHLLEAIQDVAMQCGVKPMQQQIEAHIRGIERGVLIDTD